MMGACNNPRISVSVIIPTYNRASYVGAAIESALHQTRPPAEILVVDDGSTDGTGRILGEFGPAVRVIRQPNRGRSAARNAGLRAATGDAVVFLDSDDVLMPESIETCARALEANPDVGIVYSDSLFVDSVNNALCLHSQALPGPRPSGMVLAELACRNFLTIAAMIRRSCLGDNGFEEGMDYAEDYDLWRRLASRHRFHYVDKPLLCYRVHEEMSVHRQFEESLAAQAEVQRRIIEMPEFEHLTRRERARAYCCFGVKLAMIGESGSRGYFWRATRTAPTYLAGCALLLLSLLGNRALRYAILKRRALAGNQLGSMHGPIDLIKRPTPRSALIGAGADVAFHSLQPQATVSAQAT
jgi:glycosyltransferase involved in cell wall biosynthesis